MSRKIRGCSKRRDKSGGVSGRVIFLSWFFLWIASEVAFAHSAPSASFYTSAQQEIYFLYWDLEFDRANSILAKEKKLQPSHPANFVLKSLGTTLQLLVQGDKIQYFNTRENEDRWLDSLEAGREEPGYSYSKAMIKLHWGLLKTVYGEGLSGAWAMRQAFLLLKSNHEKNPSLMANEGYFGAISIALSHIPENYQWAAQLAGLEGDENKGWESLKKAQKSGESVTVFESRLFSLLLKNYLKYPREEILLQCEELQKEFPQRGVCAISVWILNKNNASQRAEEMGSKLQVKGSVVYFDYLLGLTYFQLLDLKKAQGYFQTYISQSKSSHYKKDALHKLSILYYLEGDSVKSLKYRERVKRQGSSFYYADKQALKGAYRPWVSKDLQRARMAFEGGLFTTSLQHLSTCTQRDVPSQVEINYLKAKNYQLLNNREQAKFFYKKTIQACPKEGLYFGPMACWVLAKWSKEEGNAPQMKRYIDTLSQFKEYEYKGDIQEKVRKLEQESSVK
jgi:hypothetical protein